jgi:hypothetical protein
MTLYYYLCGFLYQIRVIHARADIGLGLMKSIKVPPS